MKKVYIIDSKRTAVGKMLGSLAAISPADFGATVVKNIIETTKIDPAKLDEVIVGNVLPAGVGQGIGRQVAINAGVPIEVPAWAISMACGSGLKAVMDAFQTESAGYTNLIIAGGTENMSDAPFLIPGKARTGYKMGDMTVLDHMQYDALRDAFSHVLMGITSENIAEKYHVSREDQDDFAFASQQKAIKAVDGGVFDDEIVPVSVKEKHEERLFARDEFPNRTSTREKLATLKPAFKKDGSVTAGNASGINDGAAFVLVASEDAVKDYALTPQVEIVAIGQGGVDPQYMGLGPVVATRAALKMAKMKIQDIDLIELNEAFAAQSLACIRLIAQENGCTPEEVMAKTNINGGAIALGHPVGASGARILVTLIHEMLKDPSKKYGLATLCIGGGMGTAVIVKRIEK